MNSNDLDDLFRRASEKYPLRADSADWSKVAAALDEDDTSLAVPPVSFRDKRRRRKLLLLLLLLPITGIGYYTWNNLSSNKHTAIIQPLSTASKKATAVSATGSKSDLSSTPTAIEAGKKNTAALVLTQANELNKDAGKGKSHTSTAHTLTAEKINSIATTDKSKPNTANKTSAVTSNTPGISKNSASGNKKHYTKPVHFSAGNSNRLQKPVKELTPPRAKDELDVVENRSTDFILDIIPPQKAFGFPVDDKALTKTPLAALPIAKNNTLSANNKKPDSKKSKDHFFYGGIVAAPDISTVKFQSIKGTGYTAGILFGMSLSKKIAVETGVYYDSKKYYSNGEYFHGKDVAFLNYVDLLNVNGTCDMIEVPVNLKYNFYTGKKTNWFATTGLSTYFMFKEGYTYNFMYNGGIWDKYYTYHKGSQNWFSVLNFSIGYEHPIGKIGNLRIEPYLKIPLSGMGTGSLPIMSSGLNIGITHRF